MRAILTAIADDIPRRDAGGVREALRGRGSGREKEAGVRDGAHPIGKADACGHGREGLDATAETWDALAVVYAGCRIEGAVPGSLRAVLPRTVAGELSALKAALVRYG